MQKRRLDTGDNTEVNASPRHRLNLVNLETAQHLAVKTTTFPKPVLAQLREKPTSCLSGSAKNTRSTERMRFSIMLCVFQLIQKQKHLRLNSYSFCLLKNKGGGLKIKSCDVK